MVHYPVAGILREAGDTSFALIRAGSLDGLFIGARGRATDTDNFLGQAMVLLLWPDSAVVAVQLARPEAAESRLKPQHLVVLPTRSPAPPRAGILTDLTELGVEFVGNARQPFLPRRLILRRDGDSLQAVVLDTMIADIRETANMVRDMFDENSDLKRPRPAGRYRGRSPFQVMETAGRADLLRFLRFVRSWPGKYMGKSYKINETFATWLINDAPFGQDDLRDSLLALSSAPLRRPVIEANAKDIRNNFLTWWSNETLEHVNGGRLDEARRINALALEAATVLDDSAGRGWAELRRGDLLERQEEWDGAIAANRAALALLRGSGELQGASYAAGNIAGILLRLSRNEEALASYDSAVAAKRQWLRTDSSGIALQRLAQSVVGRGRALEKLGRWDEALATFVEAERMFAASNTESSARDEADARSRQASIHGNRGNYALAISTYRATLQFYRDLADREGEADQLDHIGYNLSRLGEHAAAIAIWDTARTLHEAAGDLGDAGYSLSQIGQSRWTLGDFAGAIAAHRQAVAFRRTANNRTGAAYSLRKLGALFRDSGDPARGLAYLDSAAVLYHAAEDPAGEAEVLNERGDLFYTQDDNPAAIASYRSALVIQRRLGLRAEAASTLYDLGDAFYAQERWDTAGVAYGEALTLYRDLGDQVGQSKTLSNLGLLAENLHRPAGEADSLYREAMALAVRSGSRSDIAWLQFAFGRRYRTAQALDSAEAAFSRASALYRELNDAAWIARVEVNRGDLATLRGNFGAARLLLTEAAARAETAKDRKALADALSSRSWLDQLEGRFADALVIEQRSLALSVEVRNSWGIARSYVGLGNIYNDLGDYQRAVGFYRQADSIHAADGRREARATPANNIGTVYFWQRDYARAIPQFAEALRLVAEAGPDADVGDGPATYTSNIGEAWYEQGDYDRATHFLEEGLRLARKAGAVRIESGTLLILGKLALAQKRNDLARERFAAADTLARRAGLVTAVGDARTQLGRLAWLTGDLAGARGLLEDATATVRRIGYGKLLWEPLYYLALTRQAQGDTAAAQQALEEAAGVLDDLRGKVVGGKEAQKLFASGQVYTEIYETLVGILIRRGEVAKALAVLDRSNNDELRSRFGSLGVQLADSADARAVARARELRARRDGVDEQLASARAATAAGPQNAAVIRALDSIRTIADSEYLSFVYTMARNQPELKELAGVNLTDLPTANAELPRDVALLAYLPGERELYLFVATSDTVVARVIPLSRAELASRVQRLLAGLRTPAGNPQPNRTGVAAAAAPAAVAGDRDEVAAELYRILLDPALPAVGARTRLAIVPSGVLLYLPFQVLGHRDSSGAFRTLAEERTVFYETDLVVRAAERGPRSALRLAAFGNADSTLASAEQEVLTLKRMYPTATVYLRGNATEARAKALGPAFSVIHFATHGNLDYKHFDASYLTLSPTADGVEDGRLTIREVLGSNAFRARRLVVLSACNTAIADDAVPGWPLSPATAFLKRGAGAVLASLWPVDDAATAELITAFYRNLRTMDTATALRRAQLAVKANPKFAQPYYWGAWVLVGDWR